MQLKVRGFTKVTLKKFNDVVNNPLVAISPINQNELELAAGEISVNNTSARLIDGKSDEFIGLTKTIREKLGFKKGQEVEIKFSGGELDIR